MEHSGCVDLQLEPTTGTWYRGFHPKYWTGQLGTRYTRNVASRFSAGELMNGVGFEILYLSQDQELVLFEMGAMLGSPLGNPVAAHPGIAVIQIPVSVILHKVADLSSLIAQNLLKTTVQELTGDWEGYKQRSHKTPVSDPTGMAPTQELGHALYLLDGCEGFLYTSAKLPTRRNLAVFPEKLLPGSWVRFVDPFSGETHQME